MKFSDLQESIRARGIHACMRQAERIVAKLKPRRLLDLGGGKESRWSKATVCDYQCDGAFDFNTCTMPYVDCCFDLIVCEQVIEHLHNTSWFLSEIHRVMEPGGHLIISTENLVSLPNIAMMLAGRAPYSCQPLCGFYEGGFRHGPIMPQVLLPENHPVYSGLKGHVRILTFGQMRSLLARVGLKIISKCGYLGNHYILILARKIHKDETATD